MAARFGSMLTAFGAFFAFLAILFRGIAAERVPLSNMYEFSLMFTFALAVQLTGSQRIAIVALIIFFIVGLALLSTVRVREAIVDCGNDPTGVVL